VQGPVHPINGRLRDQFLNEMLFASLAGVCRRRRLAA
jgi:hypothetical protein